MNHLLPNSIYFILLPGIINLVMNRNRKYYYVERAPLEFNQPLTQTSSTHLISATWPLAFILSRPMTTIILAVYYTTIVNSNNTNNGTFYQFFQTVYDIHQLLIGSRVRRPGDRHRPPNSTASASTSSQRTPISSAFYTLNHIHRTNERQSAAGFCLKCELRLYRDRQKSIKVTLAWG